MNYHAHIYYDSFSRAKANEFREGMIKDWPALSVHSLVDRRVGPHPTPMFEVDFMEQDYANFKNYLEENRNGLSILIHPLMDDAFTAHTSEAVWLGERLELFLEIFNR